MPQPPRRNIDLSRATGSRNQNMPQGAPHRAQRPAQKSDALYRAAHSGTGTPQSSPPGMRTDAADDVPRQGAAARRQAPSAVYRAGNSVPRTRSGTGTPPVRGTTPTRASTGTRNSAQRARKKKQVRRRMWATLISIGLVLVVCIVGLKLFVNSVLNTGTMGNLAEEIKTPPQLAKQQMSLLVVGIDKTAFDGEGVQRDGIGQTDMLLYLRFDFADNTLRMLQIPRDLFMGANAPTGGTGKLNGLYKHGENQDKNRINNVAVPISETLQLPIDGYVAIDMIALREIVDVFGGIEVYVADAHSHAGSSLAAGWQTLHGDMLEFFLRDRYNTPTGDIGRLDTQRYFYSALFRRLRTATWKDIVKLTPVAQSYVDTDLSAMDTAALAIRMLKIPSSNIMMCRLPNFDSTEKFNQNHAVQVLDARGTADLLNEYFRTPETLVAAEQYVFADWPHADTPHTANVQWMSDVDADGGGTVGGAADATQTGDDLLNPPQSESVA